MDSESFRTLCTNLFGQEKCYAPIWVLIIKDVPLDNLVKLCKQFPLLKAFLMSNMRCLQRRPEALCFRLPCKTMYPKIKEKTLFRSIKCDSVCQVVKDTYIVNGQELISRRINGMHQSFVSRRADHPLAAAVIRTADWKFFVNGRTGQIYKTCLGPLLTYRKLFDTDINHSVVMDIGENPFFPVRTDNTNQHVIGKNILIDFDIDSEDRSDSCRICVTFDEETRRPVILWRNPWQDVKFTKVFPVWLQDSNTETHDRHYVTVLHRDALTCIYVIDANSCERLHRWQMPDDFQVIGCYAHRDSDELSVRIVAFLESENAIKVFIFGDDKSLGAKILRADTPKPLPLCQPFSGPDGFLQLRLNQHALLHVPLDKLEGGVESSQVDFSYTKTAASESVLWTFNKSDNKFHGITSDNVFYTMELCEDNQEQFWERVMNNVQTIDNGLCSKIEEIFD